MRATWEEDLSVGDRESLSAAVDPGLRFFTFGWLESWATTMLPYRKWTGPFRFAVARDDEGSVYAALGCAWQHVAGLKVLSLGGYFHPLRGLLVSREGYADAAQSLAQLLHSDSSVRAFRVGPVESDRPEFASMAQALTELGWRRYSLMKASNFAVDLPHSYDDFASNVGKSIFKRVAYVRRKIERKGTVRIERYQCESAAEWEKVFVDLKKIESRSWTGTSHADTRYIEPESLEFWRSYVANPDARSTMVVWIMYLDDEPVSFTAVLDSKPVRYLITTAYDPAVRKFSTGTILFNEMFADAIELGIRTLNLGLGDSGYKTKWGANRLIPAEDVIFFKPGILNFVIYSLLQLKSRLPSRS